MINLSSLLGGGMLLKQQLITESGEWVRPAKMAGNTVWVTMIGGGEAGNPGSSGSGGWGGEYFIDMPVDIGALHSVSCTIGQGGNQHTTSTRQPGGPTSFGSLLTVLGGSRATGKGTPTMPVQSPPSSGLNTPLGFGGRYNGGTSHTGSGGGGGLILDDSGMAGSTGGSITNAQGYGAGGAVDGIAYAGAAGAILVKWPEFV